MVQSGVQILLQSLEKKNTLLKELVSLSVLQEDILKQDDLDMDAFDAAIEKQDVYVKELEKLDEGFEAFYDKVREDLRQNKEKYRDEILRMQGLIQQITDQTVTLKANNMRNNMLAEKQFKKKQQSIGSSVSKTRVARNYYNSMNNLHQVQPQFYDSKK